MKVALVHDYLNEFGGAERVLLALSEIWPKAPIYTAFYREGSPAYARFGGKKIITSWAQKVPFFASFLYSPLRFLVPLIWNSFDFSEFDLVVTSSSWYVTKGVTKKGIKSIKISEKTIEICYCHTPPRYLYGYKTSFDWQKYWPVKVYALIVNHFLRVYDFEAAQRVDWFIANSEEVKSRIKKFYRRESVVIYPPVDTKKFPISNFQFQISNKPLNTSDCGRLTESDLGNHDSSEVGKGYFLVVSRLVASKNVDLAVEVCTKLGLPLKVVGSGRELEKLKKLADVTPNLADRSKKVKNEDTSHVILSDSEGSGKDSSVDLLPQNDKNSTVDFLGEVDDKELIRLYQNCRVVVFPASQEDFGLVPVEAMAAGKPVIANAEGGVLESVVDAIPNGKGKCTGVYFNPPTGGSLTLAINNFMRLEKQGYFDPKFIRAHAQKFSKERFKREILKFVESKVK